MRLGAWDFNFATPPRIEQNEELFLGKAKKGLT
jgi:hypothetical protein